NACVLMQCHKQGGSSGAGTVTGVANPRILKHRLVGRFRVALINMRVNAQGTEECSVGYSDDTIALNSRNSRYTTEEHAADNRIRTRVLDYLELDMSLHIPNQIFAVVEAAACGNSPAVQNRAGHRVAHPDGLGTLGAIP